MPETLIKQTDTAIASYSQSKQEGVISTINDRIEEYIKTHAPCSRNDLQRALGLTARQTSCSTWHLLHKGTIIVHGEKVDSVTHRTLETLYMNPFPELELKKKKSDKDKLKEIREFCEYQIKDKWGDLVDAKDILKIISG